MMRGLAAAAVLAMVACAAYGAPQLLPGLKIDNSGAMSLDGLSFSLIHFSPDWAMAESRDAVKADGGYPKQTDNSWELRGQFATKSPNGAFALRQALRAIDANSASYEVSVKSDTGVQSNTLALMLRLPTDRYAGTDIQIDGQATRLPEKLGEMSLLNRNGVKKIVIPTISGRVTLEGNVSISIQDDRKFNAPDFALRISLSPGAGLIKDAALQLTMSYAPFAVTALDIAPAANMAWADETDGDRKGGWSDQGAENDLHMVPLGTRRFGPVEFRVIDPAANAGKACIVLAGPQREYFPKSATVAYGDKPARYLYLLHASAWTPPSGQKIGTIRVTAADGTTTPLDVQSGREVGNWWAPAGLSNGAVVWTAENKSAFVGLYLSRFEVPEKPIRSITLESTGKAVWMIAAMSASSDAIPLPADSPVYIVANDQWKPIEHTQEIEPGSILDFSGLVDAPAGKYGNVVVKGPHFEFANRPGKPVRFYGANTCFSANFPSKPEAEKLAERLSRIGYNCIRIHHYDYDLTDKSAKDSVTLDPGQLDKLEYYIYCLKQRGIYVNIDLYTIRETRANEIPELNRPVRSGYKACVPLLDSAMKNWQAFARNVVTHKNPYTGMTLAEDPVLVGICPLNEDPLLSEFNAAPDIRKLYDQRFEAWMKEKGIAPKDAAERNSAMARFLSELQVNANRKTFAFLKSLGVKAPLTSVNCVDAMALTPIRAEEEYVDNHAYWDHPGFPERQWSLPHSYGNKSALAGAAGVPRNMMATRIVGKPFTCTEWNYCFPNRYRAEAGPLTGAYAALQDWDGLYRFAYSHDLRSELRPGAGNGFDLANAPLDLLSERIGMLLYVRGDVAPAKRIVAYPVGEADAYATLASWGTGNFPQDYQLLGLHTGIGCTWTPAAAKGAGMAALAATLPADVDLKARRIASDTGQIQLAADTGTFRVVTDRTECFILTQPGQLAGKAATVTTDAPFSTIAISAMDGKSIETSSRLLLIHLTDVQNNKVKYRNKAMTLMEQWGELPHLVRAGKAVVQLKLGEGRPAKCYALQPSGHRREAVEVKTEGGTISFTANTHLPAGGCMAYELVRE